MYLVLGLLLGTVAALVFVVSVFLLGGQTVPVLTRTAYDTAYERWRRAGPASYDLDLALRGDQQGEIHVEVRKGSVTRMTRDGVSPARKVAWDYWSVPGQMDVIELDLDQADKPRSQLVLRALFDGELGYPRAYQRIDLATRHEVRWDTTGFTPR